MKKIFLVLTILVTTVFGSTQLDEAYAKEFAFLKAQKEMLTKRVKELKSSNAQKLEAAKGDIEKLQQKVLSRETQSEHLSDTLFHAQQNLETMNDDTSLLEAVISQGTSSLKEYGIELKLQKEDYPATLKDMFVKSLKLRDELSSLKVENGSFYLQDGSTVTGKIVKIGNIATYGVSDKTSGILVPAGDHKLKIFTNVNAKMIAQALADGAKPEDLQIFIYENNNKEVANGEEKTLLDVINSAGIIGWVIVVLGLVGVAFLVLRVVYLQSSTGAKTLPQETLASLLSSGVEKTLEVLKPKKGAAARVLKATVRNLDRDREHVEDIISEAIIHESSRLDKLSSTILVIAAVAPLLGLLGTVTGMIATFDIITEFGTGDPKLLSGGISIALVTTELGLIVAIPLLLGGNLLNSWAESIKDSMEHSALHIVNEYNKRK
ncbi:MotA/TolQ/ExbB proton channel family protein [Sulfurimonas sp.]|uniref:MotA/TolQ/ExbB proton channel family protein n=1 Tax=Sulfurimonas sp. TaxID=2022749 RepID=UPI003D0B5E25